MEAVTALRMPPFHRYRNQSGHSGVVAYALLPDAIAVQFNDGRICLYSHDCPGRRHVSRNGNSYRDEWQACLRDQTGFVMR